MSNPGVISEKMALSDRERKRILSAARALRPRLEKIALEIWRNPEVAFEERYASSLLKGFLEDEGFIVESGLAGMKTAFRARLARKRPRPAVGFLAEMDALPGLGHGCGHNLIGTAAAGAAAALRRAMPVISGRVEVVGCPAEESGGGKVRLARRGCFDRLDACLIIHPDTKTEVFKLSLALVEVRLAFIGKAAHASAEPEKGINALDAMIETFCSVGDLREGITERGRVHGIITHGGSAANIIPDRTEAVFYVRGRTIEEAKYNIKKLLWCARKAARSTGARLSARVKTAQAYEPFIPNRTLGGVFERNLKYLDIKIEQGPEDKGLGSTDVGNVSRRVPIISPTVKIPGLRSACHSPGFARAAGGRAGIEMMMQAAAAMALTGAEVLKDSSLRQKMRSEFRRSARGGR